MRTDEFQLAVRYCRLAFDPVEAGSPDLRNIDWQLFYRLVQFHRVQGLVWQSLSTLEIAVPGEVARRIADDAARIAAINREGLAECQKLSDALRSKAMDFLFLKGLPLGVLAYGTPWVKAAVDIDLLVEEARLDDAVAELRTCGFRREDGRPEDIDAVRAWHRFRKDSEWGKPESTARVDLHTRLTDNPALIPTLGLGSPRQLVEVVPGCELPTLSTEQTFAHLCVHGASSAWFRLKWVSDLAALFCSESGDELRRLYLRSQELGAGRAAGQALLLADEVYGTLGKCPDLRDRLMAERWTRWLYRQAVQQLAGSPEPTEPTARRTGTLRIHITQFLLLPCLAFKASELVRQARAAFR